VKHDRNGKKSSKAESGNHRPSKPNGKVRSEAGSNHGSKREEKKGQKSSAGGKSTSQASPANITPPPARQATPDETLIEKARAWAELHADPHTRGAMDKVLNGLSAADQRKVVLCGQRIAAGLSVKLVK
jgi:hypothetical protein